MMALARTIDICETSHPYCAAFIAETKGLSEKFAEIVYCVKPRSHTQRGILPGKSSLVQSSVDPSAGQIKPGFELSSVDQFLHPANVSLYRFPRGLAEVACQADGVDDVTKLPAPQIPYTASWKFNFKTLILQVAHHPAADESSTAQNGKLQARDPI
jgi:hypothetical protein